MDYYVHADLLARLVTDLLQAVIWQILVQAGTLLEKVKDGPALLSGGLTQIRGFQEYAQLALGRECRAAEHGIICQRRGARCWRRQEMMGDRENSTQNRCLAWDEGIKSVFL